MDMKTVAEDYKSPDLDYSSTYTAFTTFMGPAQCDSLLKQISTE